MDFASSTRAAENRTRWKGIIANSSVVTRRPPKVMELNRIEKITVTEKICYNVQLCVSLCHYVKNRYRKTNAEFSSYFVSHVRQGQIN